MKCTENKEHKITKRISCLSIILVFGQFNFRDGFSLLFEFLSPLEISLPHLLQIFFKINFSLLAILCFLPIFKNGLDMFFQLVWMPDVNQLKCVFYSDFASACQIVHQELDEIKQISRFEPCLIENASFVHERKFVLIDGAIKVFIDFPNPLLNLGLTKGEIQFS